MTTFATTVTNATLTITTFAPSVLVENLEVLPTSPAPLSYRFRSRTNTLKSKAASGKIWTRKLGGQYYELTLVYPPMQRSEYAALVGFLLKQDGPVGKFKVTIPQLSDTAGTVVGNKINFNNDTKLHEVISTGPLVVHPTERVAGGTAINSPVYARCSLLTDIQEVEYGNDDLIRLEVNLTERI